MISVYDLNRIIDIYERSIFKERGCLETTFSSGSGHYSNTSIRGKKTQIHRYMLSIYLGRNLVGFALHKCNNTKCINIYHLYEGTQKDNMVDRIRNGNNPHLKKIHCPKGHEYTERNTALNKQGQRYCRSCHSISAVISNRKARMRKYESQSHVENCKNE